MSEENERSGLQITVFNIILIVTLVWMTLSFISMQAEYEKLNERFEAEGCAIFFKNMPSIFVPNLSRNLTIKGIQDG